VSKFRPVIGRIVKSAVYSSFAIGRPYNVGGRERRRRAEIVGVGVGIGIERKPDERWEREA